MDDSRVPDDDTENVGDESIPHLIGQSDSLFDPRNALFRSGAQSQIKSKLDLNDHKKKKELRMS